MTYQGLDIPEHENSISFTSCWPSKCVVQNTKSLKMKVFIEVNNETPILVSFFVRPKPNGEYV